MGSLGMDTGIGKLPTAGQYHAASAVDALFALSCVVGIVFAFLRGKTAGMVVAGVIAVLAILMIVLQPSFDGAALQEENSDKVLATVIGIIGLVGAGLLLALKMVRDKPTPQTA
jgi:drug/metabolite transporter (DMT)-like permease